MTYPQIVTRLRHLADMISYAINVRKDILYTDVDKECVEALDDAIKMIMIKAGYDVLEALNKSESLEE